MGSTPWRVLLIAAVLAGGCAAPPEAAAPPTMPPAKPPETPTDLVPHDVVAGRITRGGSGPCYQLITDEGTEYALYSTAGIELRDGVVVRVKFAPLSADPHCGPGRPVALINATVLG